MHQTYVPPAALFERTRCTIARLLIPITWGLALLTLRVLPRTHPFRLNTYDQIWETRELGKRATAIHSPGRLLPAHLPHLVSAYLIVDALSYRVKGPFDLVSTWTLDDRVRLLSRFVDAARAAPLAFAGLLG